MRRLAHQIHLTVLLALLPFAVLIGVAWHLIDVEAEDERFLAGAAELMGDLLPPADAPVEETTAAVARLARLMPVAVGLWSPAGELLTRTSAEVPSPDPRRTVSGMVREHGPGFSIALRLPDGRWLVATHASQRGHRAAVTLSVIALLAIAIGLGALPLSRRLTRRLERLRTRVEDLGHGELTARVEVEGRDEVADLARSFNAAAERIEHLVEAQRTTLVGASHELRSPLARLRMALELMADGSRADLREQVAADITELDGLIDEILLASRLEALRELEVRDEPVDLLAVAAEEAARVEAEVDGSPLTLPGNERLLRRMVRNLLENAVRHGDAGSVRIGLQRAGDGARIEVDDGGRGVAPQERDRIFEPFYRPVGSAESGRGYGLGLALVRRIARLHGGDARCLEAPGGGCRFEVTIRPHDPAPPSPQGS